MAGYRPMSTVQTSDQTFSQYDGATISTENISQQQSFWQRDVSDGLRKVVPPVILLLGSLGNVMTVLVMRALAGQTSDPSMCVYFPCLALCDQVVLTLGLGRQWIRSVFLYDLRNLHAIVCKLHKFLVFAVSGMSTWILVALTSQRVMTVMWPLRQRLTSTRKRAIAVVVVVGAVNCLLDVGLVVMYSPQRSELSGLVECSVVTDTPVAAFYEDHVLPWLDILTGILLPFIILVVNNLILAFKVRQSANASRHMIGGNTQQQAVDTQRAKQATSLSITLIVTSLTFMLLNSSIPASFFLRKFFLSSLYSDGQLNQADLVQIRADFGLSDALMDLLWYCNSAVNFYLYFLTGPTFRREARRLLCWRRKH